MAKQPEVFYDLVPSDYSVNRRGTIQEVWIDSFQATKNLVFTEDASLLTPREREVMEGFIQGHTSQEVAQSLVISEKSVKQYVFQIADRLRDMGCITHGGRITVISALLQIGELELREPELIK